MNTHHYIMTVRAASFLNKVMACFYQKLSIAMRDRNKNTLNKENKGKIDAHSEEGCSENDFFGQMN